MVPFQSWNLVLREEARARREEKMILQHYCSATFTSWFWIVLLLSMVKGQRKGCVGFTRGSAHSRVSGQHRDMTVTAAVVTAGSTSSSSAGGRSGTGHSDQGQKDPLQRPVEILVRTNAKSHPMTHSLYPGFPIAIFIVFPFRNRAADWKLRLYL